MEISVDAIIFFLNLLLKLDFIVVQQLIGSSVVCSDKLVNSGLVSTNKNELNLGTVNGVSILNGLFDLKDNRIVAFLNENDQIIRFGRAMEV